MNEPGCETPAINPPVEPAEPDAEVHRHPLLCERCMAPRRRRQAGDQRRLARPEACAAGSLDRDQHECVPWPVHERKQADPERLHDQPAGEHAAGAEPVDQRAGEDARRELGRCRHRDDEPRQPEPESAHVVEVDDEERQDDAVPEGVHHAAELEQPDVARQLRIEGPPPPAQVGTGIGSGRDNLGSSERRYARMLRGYSRLHGRSVVDDASRAEPESGKLRLPVVRRDAARDERARADRTRGRRLETAARPSGLRGRGSQARRTADRGRVAGAALGGLAPAEQGCERCREAECRQCFGYPHHAAVIGRGGGSR